MWRCSNCGKTWTNFPAMRAAADTRFVRDGVASSEMDGREYDEWFHACCRDSFKFFTAQEIVAKGYKIIYIHSSRQTCDASIQEDSSSRVAESAPIPMRLPCPACGQLHIDEGEFVTRPHHTHACQYCGLVWRPAVVPTVGVKFLPGFKNEPEDTMNFPPPSQPAAPTSFNPK